VSGIFSRLTSYSDEGFSRFLRQVFLSSAGYDDEDLSRPIIGIGHSISDFSTCHREMPQLVEAVSRGVLEAGGLPMVFPTMSLPEVMINPTSMLYRNLLAMEIEETLSSHPIDGAVLIGGCDKTVPAQIMGAVSADVPFVELVVGPMLTSSWEGERLGACTDCRQYWARMRRGELSDESLEQIQGRLATTGGTCMVMGTASTMAAVAEALGVAVSHSATAPSPTGDRLRIGVRTGRVAVDAVRRDWRPSRFLTRESFENAVATVCALGGSTNAVLHLLAIAGRAEVLLDVEDFDHISKKVPVLVDCKPVGEHYLEDLHLAGGVPAVLRELDELIHRDVMTIEGTTLGEQISLYPATSNSGVIRPRQSPVSPTGGLVVLRGTLAPRGAIIKAAASSPELWRHRGPAVVFESPEDVAERIDSPELNVNRDSVLVLRNAGPIAAGMPEAGALPIPAALGRLGIRDMVRISDARMSGTAFGTVVLHVTPEAAAGGPLSLVRDGDIIELDIEAGRLDLLVDAGELKRRVREQVVRPVARRGWRRMFEENVLQADEGVDLGFLIGKEQGES
jgi:dihydroxy-acid dehydratase